MPERAFSHITLVQLDELPALRVRNNSATALIALQGAQLLEFTPHQQRPLIWLSEQAQFRRGQSVRGGIPVCWPWFGDLSRNPDAVHAAFESSNAPAHGLVRAQDWLLESVIEQSITEESDHTDIVLRYPTPANLWPDWPHAAELRLTIGIGRALRLQLTTRNTGDQPMPLTQALHTYFAISAIDKISVENLDGTRYVDTLQDWREQTQHGAARFTGEVDRIYLDLPAAIRLRDDGWNRTIDLKTANSKSAVLWNPWIEKSKRLSQFAADAWQRMVCIESANVWDDAVLLLPGATHTLDVEISASDS